MILNERRQSSAHHPRPRLGLLICLLIVLLGSCSPGNSPTIPVSDKQIDIPGLPPDPGAGNLAGKLVGTITQQALGGLRVSVNSKSAISASDGSFLLEGIGSGHLAISIAGEAVYQRVAAIDTSAGRSILLDVIEKQSAFNLNFYRELARGHHPTEGNLLAIQRWTKATPPTIYLDTNAAATDAGIVDAGMLKRAREVIKYMLPVLSGDTYASAPIQVRSFASYDFDAIPENTIAISFDDTLYRQGALGVTFTEPNFTAQATTSLRKAWIFLLHNEQYYQQGGVGYEELTAHELGHAFGYRHTSLLPSVMEKNGAYGGLFSEHDRLHMRVMYKRPFGNLDVDTDVLPNAKVRNRNSASQIFIECAPGNTESRNLLPELRHTDGIVGAFLSQNPALRIIGE